MRQRQQLTIFLSLFILFSPSLRGQNPDYNFTIVTLSGETIDGLVLAPLFGNQICINNAGEIVFFGTYVISPGNYNDAVLTPKHVLAKTGDIVDGQALTNFGSCGLNNYGTLVFGGGLPSGYDGVLLKQGQLPAKLLVAGGSQVIDGLKVTFIYNMAINDFGEIVFSANYATSDGSVPFGIFTPKSALLVPGSEVDHLVLSSIDPAFGLSLQQLFFHASNASIGEGIFSLHKLIVKTGDVIDGYQLVSQCCGVFSGPAASSRGKLAFGAAYPTGDSGIFTPKSFVGPTGGPFPIPAEINNAGTVVYNGVNGTDLVVNQTPLLSIGDTIDGHTVNTLGGYAINDLEAIAFIAGFADGTAGVVLATPKEH
jgi:hypothetical protein